MGLAEKRRIALIKENHGPRFQSELNSVLGFEIPFHIMIESFPENATILDCYDFYYESYGPGMIVQVFKDICVDDMGKNAVKGAISKIVFENSAASPENPGTKQITLENKTLTIRESFYGYSDILFGAEEVKTFIENKL